MYELFGREELNNVLEKLKETNEKLVSDLIPEVLPLSTVLKVCQSLLKENVPIKDMRSILESLSDSGTRVKDPLALTESCRQALYRTITQLVKSDNGDVPLYTLDRQIEEKIAQR